MLITLSSKSYYTTHNTETHLDVKLVELLESIRLAQN